MKKNMFLLIAFITLLLNGAVSAQSNLVDLGMFKKPSDHSKLEVRVRPMADVTNVSYSGGVFTVRFPTAYGVTLSAVPGSSPYGYTFAGPVGQADGYDYYRYQFSGSVFMVNWKKNTEYPVLTLEVNGTPPPKAVFELVTKNDWTRANNSEYYQEMNAAQAQRQFYTKPLKLTAFRARALPDRTVRLDWEFESETDLAYSDVEYTADGSDFGRIATTPADINTDRTSPEYTYQHLKPQPGMNYYRIRMVDINGVVEYSSVRALNFDDLDADFAVFPNPTAGPLTLVSRNLDTYTAGVKYQVLDNTGKVIRFDRVVDDNLTLDVSDLASGAYYLRVLNGQTQVAKFQVAVVSKN